MFNAVQIYKLNSPLFMLDDKIIHYITNVLRDVKNIGAKL